MARKGHRFHDLPSRRFVGRGLWKRLRALGTMAVSANRARRLVGRLEAEVVVGTGGFASVPAVLGVRFLQGVTAAVVNATGPAILADVVPEERRGRAYGSLIGAV